MAQSDTSIRNVIIGLLVAYIVVDCLMHVMSKQRCLLSRVFSSLDDENTMMALILGILAGILAWYLSKNMYTVRSDIRSVV